MEENDAIEAPQPEEPAESPHRIRMRGLLLLVLGALLTPVFFIVAYFLGLLLAMLFGDHGPVRIAAGLVAIPMVMGFMGWLELVTGVSFRRLQTVFDKGGLAQLGLTLLVIASGAGLIALFVFLYTIANERSWF